MSFVIGHVNFAKNLFTFISSLFDVGSDVINSLDFMNISSTVVDSMERIQESSSLGNVTDSMNSSEYDIDNNNGEYRDDFSWGVISMCIVFLPGMLAAIPMIVYSMDKSWKVVVVAMVLSVTFPVAFFKLTVCGIIHCTCLF